MKKFINEKFSVEELELEGVKIITPRVYEDSRGYFFECFNVLDFKNMGIEREFVQTNISKSKKGVIRGLHFQNICPQGKLISVISGKIYDVVVDIRKDSKTFGKYCGVELDSQNKKMIYVPRGYAHGFLSLEEDTKVEYRCDDFYYPNYEGGIRFDDEDIGIDWQLDKYQIKEVILSEKDSKSGSLKNYAREYQGEKVLILGAKGQLGQEFIRFLEEKNIECVGFGKDSLDVRDSKKIEEYLDKYHFDMVINCSGYNDVDRAENNCEEVFLVNSKSVSEISKICEKRDIIFMTFSTDFVFDGKKGRPYVEKDVTNPLSHYGKSKLVGEKEVLDHKKTFVVRTSWLYGAYGDNFSKRVVELSKKCEHLKMAGDMVSAPTYTRDLVEFCWELIHKKEYGLYHFSNAGECSKYTQAKYILKKINWQGEIEEVRSEDFNSLAKRPKYSKLDSSKIERVVGRAIPHWGDAMDRFLQELEKNCAYEKR